MNEDKGKVSVCLVDDDLIYQLVTKKMLENMESVENIMQFYDGEPALDFLKGCFENKDFTSPDLVLLDINMPKVNGWQFIEELSKFKQDLPQEMLVYMVSSSISSRDRVRAQEFSEIEGYMVKPVNREKLHDLLIETIEKLDA